MGTMIALIKYSYSDSIFVSDIEENDPRSKHHGNFKVKMSLNKLLISLYNV